MPMPPKILKEWAKEELKDALIQALSDLLVATEDEDERTELLYQAGRALTVWGYDAFEELKLQMPAVRLRRSKW